jgi:hypothetical protein
MPTYSIILGANERQYCAITKRPSEMPEETNPKLGDRIGPAYVAPVEFHMSKLVNPQGLQIADVIHNAVGYLFVSARMKGLLADNAKGEIEFLPIRLMNHKGRLATDTCFIANVIGKHDCADRSQSKGIPSPTHDDRFITCDRLVLDDNKVPADVNIFRTALYPSYVLVRDDLRSRIEEAKMVVRFLKAGEESEG